MIISFAVWILVLLYLLVNYTKIKKRIAFLSRAIFLRKPYRFETIKKFADNIISVLLLNEGSPSKPYFVTLHEENPKQFEMFRDELMHKLEKCFTAKDWNQQKINLRKYLLEETEAYVLNEAFFYRNDEDRNILMAAGINASDGSSFTGDQKAGLFMAQGALSTKIIRNIQGRFFNDAKRNDYFDVYSTICRKQIGNLYDAYLAKHKRGDYVLPSFLLEIMTPLGNQVKESALSGQDKIYPIPSPK